MADLGKYNRLTVIKTVDYGYYLDGHDLGEILLPRKQAPQELKPGDRVTVFLYLDSEDRPIATCINPKAQVGQYAYLNVVAINNVGAFLDWGLEKDLLLPYGEQHRPLEVGHSYLVYVHLNAADGRIIASSKVDKFLIEEAPDFFRPQQPVDLIIANSSELGFKAVVNHKYWGLLHREDVHERLSFGQYKQGYIKRIRTDGKIDLSLHSGQETRDKNAEQILQALKRNNGHLALHDKSSPEQIQAQLGMSKAAFKKTIGALYKQRKITIGDDGIRLT